MKCNLVKRPVKYLAELKQGSLQRYLPLQQSLVLFLKL